MLAEWLGKLFDEGQAPPSAEDLHLLARQLAITTDLRRSDGTTTSPLAMRARALITASPLDIVALRALRDELRRTATQETTAPIRAEELEDLLDEVQELEPASNQGGTMTMSSTQLAHLIDDSRAEPVPKRAHVIAANRQPDDDQLDDTTIVDTPSTTVAATPPPPPEKQSETLQLDARDLAKLLRDP